MGFRNILAEDGAELLLAHELLHLANTDQGFLVDVLVTSGGCCLHHVGFVRVLANAAAFDHLEAGPRLSVIDGLVLCEGVHVRRPLGKLVRLADDLGNLRIRQQSGLTEIHLGQRQITFRTSAALVPGTAEATPCASGEIACADERLRTGRTEHFVAPALQVFGRNAPRGGIAKARLEDGHAHRLDVIERLGHVQHTQPVDHELRVFLRVNLHALAQLQVNDVSYFIGDDDHVRCAEAAVHILGSVDALFHQQYGAVTFPASVLDFTNDEGHILVHRFQQLVLVVFGRGSGGALL